jgi:hypothetical protein
MSDTFPYMDRDDAIAYIMRYPVVMLEETSGIPADGNFNEIYQNAMSTGLRNNRNIKKGPDIKCDDIFTWHEANYGFNIGGDALDPPSNDCGAGSNYNSYGCKLNRCLKNYMPNRVNPEQSTEAITAINRTNLRGPNNFSELATLWYTYQKRYTENKNWVPLFIRLKLNGNDPTHIIERGPFEKFVARFRYKTYDQYGPRDGPRDVFNIYTPYDNIRGIDRTIYRFQVVFSLKNYVSVGDIFTEADKLGSSVSVLFAHNSICNSVDRPNLYVNLGQTYDSGLGPYIPSKFIFVGQKYDSDLGPFIPRNNVYVLRTALFKTFTNQTLPGIDYNFRYNGATFDRNCIDLERRENVGCSGQICNGITEACWVDETIPERLKPTIYYNVSNVLVVNNDLGNNYYKLLTNPKTIFDDLVSAFMKSQGNVANISWKGLNSQENKNNFISALCKESPNLPAYPFLCECLGNGNEEAELKKLNPQFSMFCHSKKCYDANDNDPDIFKYRPGQQPSCPSITLCNIKLEGNVFKYVNINNNSCSQVIDTNNLSGSRGSAITIRSHHNAICFMAVVVFIVFAFIVLILKVNKNTV